MLQLQDGTASFDPFDPIFILRGLQFTGWQLSRLVFGRAHWEQFIADNAQLADVLKHYSPSGPMDALTRYFEGRQEMYGE